MIKNNAQYLKAKKEYEKFKSRFDSIVEEYKSKYHDEKLIKLYTNATESKLKELKDDIEEYEDLVSVENEIIEIKSIHELAKGIIKIRIASNISQKKLAIMMGIQEQQIQRYEKDFYYKASFERILQILESLNVEIKVFKNYEKFPHLKKHPFLRPLGTKVESISMFAQNVMNTKNLFTLCASR
jgi:HTH-type transcriptional regulator / antitoxin HigA